MGKPTVRYQLKVILNHIKPSIWRRIVVPGNITLWQLHAVLQVVMGWQEMHLHSFKIQTKEYGNLDDETVGRPILDDHAFRLDRVIPKQVGFRFIYTYDFGDHWEHVLLVEKVFPLEGGQPEPVCLAGMRAGPLEDSGGPPGYMELVETLKDPNHPEYQAMREWAGGTFDPEAFNVDMANLELAELAGYDYQLEVLFGGGELDEEDEEEFDDEFLDAALTLPDGSGETPQKFTQVFTRWTNTLPADLQKTCEELPARKDFLAFLAYLRDHKVKGTTATGNLPLKAVREINALFVEPQPLDHDGLKLRSEEEAFDVLFMHMIAYNRRMVEGGPGERWVLTDHARAFFELSPAIQVLDLYLTWLLLMPWALLDDMGVTEENEARIRKEIIQLLAQQPPDQWLPVQALAQQVAEISAWQPDPTLDPQTAEAYTTLLVLHELMAPMLRLGAIEADKETETVEVLRIRYTPLGSSLLSAIQEYIQ